MSNRLIVKNSIMLYIRLIVTLFVGLLTSRYVLIALGASDFGLYNVVGGIVTMMAFVNTVMVTTTYRYIAYELGKPDGNINKIFNISLSIHLVISIIVIIASLTIGLYYIYNYLIVPEGKLSDAVFTFLFSMFNMICVIIGTPYQGLLVAKEKFAVTVPIEISTKLLNLGLVILLMYLPGNHLRIYVVFMTIVHMLNPILYILYCIKKYWQEVKWNFQKEWKIYKEMFSFSGYTMIGAAACVGESQGSAIIINRFFGTILNASFGIANRVNSMVQMFAQGLSQAIVPQITKSYSSGDHNRSSQLVMLSSKFSFFLIMIPLLPILLETDFILNIWLKEVPDFTTIFVQIMLIKSIITSLNSGIPSIIQASGKIKWFQLISSTILLLCLPLAYFAYTLGYPPHFISVIYLFTSLLTFITTLILLKVIINYDILEFIKKVVIKANIITIIISPLFAIQFIVPEGALRFFCISLLAEVVLFVSIYFIGLEKDERIGINKYISLAKNKILDYAI